MKKIFQLTSGAMLIFCGAVNASASGDAVRVEYGTVVGIQQVKLDSAAGQGVALGGIAGLASAHHKHGKDKVKNAAIGAVLGGLLAAAAQGNRTGNQFMVELRSGAEVSYTSESRDIQIGDCVAVEQGKHINLRRVTAAFCQYPHEQTQAYHETGQQDAQACHDAKDALLKAPDEQSAKAAVVKVQILCAH